MMTKIKIKDWLVHSIKQLKGSSEFPYLESQILLAFALQKTREWLVTHADDELEETQFQQVEQLKVRLMNGEPLPYITGKQAFFGLDFFVNRDVLIPRPETEQLVEECLRWLEDHPSRRTVADVGTGSGIIAITLADHFDDLHLTAVDLSEKALVVARINAEAYHAGERIRFLQSDLLEGIDKTFDLIAANLPYIPSAELKTLPVAKFEPLLALDGGVDGLVYFRRLFAQIYSHIKPRGLIVLEIESGSSDSVFDLSEEMLPGSKKEILTDLANHPRILKIQL